ncbi:MAG: S4 domain-containing protein [Flavobacteriaceae bacterium]|jgi:ribosome-associated heat shock protein Hsp15|nr:S4 domain-containing protein [Flavobacteriaceae bacterium]MDG1057307.1 S4 domain-containing protein [Flavobacteriaceae bacterium]CAI8153295.1 MAG: Heat shock protein 15 [Formosa sp. Hel3_A1_48]
MRIDKFLWCLRYFKTRSIASNATKKGQVRVNESIVKPSREVYPTDEITVRINQINYRMTILDLPKSRVGAKLVDQYRQDTTPKSEFEAKELLKLAKEHYRKKGEGRPTKKDRRDIEGYLDFGKN